MAETIQMPKLGFDMAEGTLVRWVKKVGDPINKGDVIAEIETDKATIEIETTASGTILKHLVNEGDVVPVGTDIALVGEPGEATAGAAPAARPTPEVAPEPAPAEAPAAAPTQPAVAVQVKAGDGQLPGGVKASPLARRIARDKGLDLSQIPGSGPGGRIVRRDVEGFAPVQAPAALPKAAPAPVTAPAVAPAAAPSAAPVTPPPSFGPLPEGPDIEVIPTSKLRGRIGRRMVEAKQQVPHFYVTTEMDVEALLKLRQQLNASLEEGAAKISVNDMIVKATALTLRKFPNLNSHFYGDRIVRHKRIHIGIAVALEEGLINVVARDADRTALGTMAAQNKDMVARARDGKVKPEEIEGATFTISNLGPYDVDQFIAIINPPEAGILAIGAAKQVPVVQPDGTLGVSWRMKVTISVDHRISDGAEAARFLQEMKKLIENPMSLLI
ncbi:MAG: 2-oxo acid dehydrogenase subunit E2 [Anaerolineae bacterium]|nr:2-oxo acid dehydrogenase subunit E2 [Anaerolineae bacterium]